MTDRAPITDEDLSEHLDRRAAPDVAARIAADPNAQVRLEALRNASRALADTPIRPLDGATVDQLVSRALLASDDQGTPDGDHPATAVTALPSGPKAADAFGGDVASGGLALTAHQARRMPPTWLVAAAVILVVALGIGLVVSGRDTRGNDQAVKTAATESTAGNQGSASNSTDATSSDAAAAGQASEHGAASGAAPSTTQGPAFSAARAVDLGTFATPRALRTALADRFPDAPATASSGGAPATTALQRCGTQVAVTLNLKSDPLRVGYATVEGRQVLVYEFASTSFTDQTPTTLIAAVGNQSCDPVVTFER